MTIRTKIPNPLKARFTDFIMDADNHSSTTGSVDMPEDARIKDDSIDKSFEMAIRKWMVPIDKYLSDQRIPIPDRIWAASHEFVDYCILDIEGDTKENYLFRPWYKFIHRVIQSWYNEKYGAALYRPDDAYLGACEILGSLFKLRVPAYLKRDGVKGETIWITLPCDIQVGENPSKWLVNPPNLDILDNETRQQALDEIVAVSCLLRSIHNDLTWAKKPDEISHELASNISSHLMASAERLTESHHPAFGLSCWESHQAVEKAFKLLGRQHQGSHQKTHEIIALARYIPDTIKGIDESILAQVPNKKRIIQMRAGEGPSVDAQEAYRLYRLGLQITFQCTSAMPHEIFGRNASIELRKPPWA